MPQDIIITFLRFSELLYGFNQAAALLDSHLLVLWGEATTLRTMKVRLLYLIPIYWSYVGTATTLRTTEGHTLLLEQFNVTCSIGGLVWVVWSYWIGGLVRVVSDPDRLSKIKMQLLTVSERRELNLRIHHLLP